MPGYDRQLPPFSANQPVGPAIARWLGGAWRWVELAIWSIVVRALVSQVPLTRALRVLDAVPTRHARKARHVDFPADRQVRLAGACLGRSLARSQYLHLRGVSHRVVIGVTGGANDFRAHAWVAPYEEAPEGFVELRSIDR